MKVFIAQLKCENNHCIMATAGEYETAGEAKLLETILRDASKHNVAAGALKLECGLCRSTNLHVELKPTIFRTLEEARPHLRDEERRQMETAKEAFAFRQRRN